MITPLFSLIVINWYSLFVWTPFILIGLGVYIFLFWFFPHYISISTREWMKNVFRTHLIVFIIIGSLFWIFWSFSRVFNNPPPITITKTPND